jgi:hypothetical protein
VIPLQRVRIVVITEYKECVYSMATSIRLPEEIERRLDVGGWKDIYR